MVGVDMASGPDTMVLAVNVPKDATEAALLFAKMMLDANVAETSIPQCTDPRPVAGQALSCLDIRADISCAPCRARYAIRKAQRWIEAWGNWMRP